MINICFLLLKMTTAGKTIKIDGHSVDYMLGLQTCRTLICSLPHHFCPRCYDILHVGCDLQVKQVNINLKPCPTPWCGEYKLHMMCPSCSTTLHVLVDVDI